MSDVTFSVRRLHGSGATQSEVMLELQGKLDDFKDEQIDAVHAAVVKAVRYPRGRRPILPKPPCLVLPVLRG
jgi:hypothetical protein